MIMAGTWVIFVKITMQVPQRPMVGAMLGVAVKALFMGAAVSFIDLPVEAEVSSVITRVPAVLVVVGERRSKWGGHDKHCRRNERFAEGHGGSPMRTGPSEKSRGQPCRNNHIGDPLNVIAIKRLSTVHVAEIKRFRCSSPLKISRSAIHDAFGGLTHRRLLPESMQTHSACHCDHERDDAR